MATIGAVVLLMIPGSAARRAMIAIEIPLVAGDHAMTAVGQRHAEDRHTATGAAGIAMIVADRDHEAGHHMAIGVAADHAMTVVDPGHAAGRRTAIGVVDRREMIAVDRQDETTGVDPEGRHVAMIVAALIGAMGAAFVSLRASDPERCLAGRSPGTV